MLAARRADGGPMKSHLLLKLLRRLIGAAAVIQLGFGVAIADMAPPTPEMIETIKQYSPLIYLAEREEYLPSSLEDFFANVHLICDGKRVAKSVFELKPSD